MGSVQEFLNPPDSTRLRKSRALLKVLKTAETLAFLGAKVTRSSNALSISKDALTTMQNTSRIGKFVPPVHNNSPPLPSYPPRSFKIG